MKKGNKRLKSIVVSILVVLMVVSLAGCFLQNKAVEYDYIVTEPDFGNVTTEVKKFDELSIQIPNTWTDATSYFENEVGDSIAGGTVLFGAVHEMTNISILVMDAEEAFGTKELKLSLIDEDFAQELSSGLEQSLGMEISIDQISYGKFGEYGAAIIYFSTNYNGIPVEWIYQIIPVNDHYYQITFTIMDNDDADIVDQMVNSIVIE